MLHILESHKPLPTFLAVNPMFVDDDEDGPSEDEDLFEEKYTHLALDFQAFFLTSYL